MSSKKNAVDLEDQMKWDVSPFKARNVPTFIPTPSNKWSSEDGLFRHDPLFRSRLYSSPYVTKENMDKFLQNNDSCIPAFNLEGHDSQTNLSGKSGDYNKSLANGSNGSVMIDTDSGIASQQTQFYDNMSSMTSFRDSGIPSEILGRGEIAARILYMTSQSANKENTSTVEPSSLSSIQKTIPPQNTAKYNFDPTAPPFKPRSAMTSSYFKEVIPAVCDVRFNNSDLKAIDVANYVTGKYQNMAAAGDYTPSYGGFNKKMSLADTNPFKSDSTSIKKPDGTPAILTSVENNSENWSTNRRKLAADENNSEFKSPTRIFGRIIETEKNCNFGQNPITNSIKNSPFGKRSIVSNSEKETDTSKTRMPFNPAPGSPAPSLLKATFESNLGVSTSPTIEDCYRPLVRPNLQAVVHQHGNINCALAVEPRIPNEVQNSDQPVLLGFSDQINPYDDLDYGYQRVLDDQEANFLALTQRCLMKTELDRQQLFLQQSEQASSESVEQTKKLTFADIVQAGMDAINKHKAENPLIYDVTRSCDYPIHTSVTPVIQQTSNQENTSSDILSSIESTETDSSFGHRPSKYRTEPCTTFHTIGVCPYGERCNFYHNANDKNEPPEMSKTSRYKTRLCKTWQKAGECPYGTKCDFAHGTDDLASNSPYKPRYKTRMCKVLQQTGRCPYGAQCTFAHKQSELRTDLSLIYKYKTEICNAWALGLDCTHGSDCHFAHGDVELKRETDVMF